MLSVILGLVSTAGKLFGSWQEKKKIEAEGKVAVAKATVEGAVKRAQTQAEGDIKYDQIAAQGMANSWKDEYWTIILSIPAVLCFFPPTVEYVRDGFAVLAECPVWYQSCLVGAIVASFGLKSFMKWKNGHGSTE